MSLPICAKYVAFQVYLCNMFCWCSLSVKCINSHESLQPTQADKNSSPEAILVFDLPGDEAGGEVESPLAVE